MEPVLIVAGVGSVCACVGLVIGAMLGANRRVEDLQAQANELKSFYAKALAEQDRTHEEGVRGLRQEYESEITALKSKHARDVAHKAAALHAKTCKNIAKRGKERGAITGANA